MSQELAKLETTPDVWAMMREQATVLCKTGFLPQAIKSPEQAVAIMLKGRELGLPPMYALSNIAVINGKPVAGAELMLAVIYRDHGDSAVQVERTDATGCTLLYKRRQWPEYRAFSFTIEDAKRAGLANGPTWQKYPQAMLRARCVSAVARMAFPDSIGGMYTPEELGATVDIDEHGEMRVTAPPQPEPPSPQPALNPALVARYNELCEQAATAGLKRPKPATSARNDAILEGWVKRIQQAIADAAVPKEYAPDEADLAAVEGEVVPDADGVIGDGEEQLTPLQAFRMAAFNAKLDITPDGMARACQALGEFWRSDFDLATATEIDYNEATLLVAKGAVKW